MSSRGERLEMIEGAAQRLYRARNNYRTAKNALKEYRQVKGGCALTDSWDYGGVVSCFTDTHPVGSLSLKEWCEVCAGSQPLWETYRAASTEAGAALRVLMLRCKENAVFTQEEEL